MEAFSTKFTSAIRSHWRRQKYERIHQTGKRTKQVTLLGSAPKPKRFFKLRPTFKIRLRTLNPVRILARIRDGYVNMMLGMASKGSALSGPNGPDSLWAKRVNGLGRTKASEYEKRLIQEICNSLVASGEFLSSLRERGEIHQNAN